MMILWIAAILLGFVDCLAQVNWSYEIDDKNCDVFIQVNEDNLWEDVSMQTARTAWKMVKIAEKVPVVKRGAAPAKRIAVWM